MKRESEKLPGTGETIDRSKPRMAFNRLDFPTFGFPTIAILISFMSSSSLSSSDFERRKN
jgi:hypothetical protein